jgi:hypothetical protein
LQAFVACEGAVPVEAGVGLVAIQFEKIRLVKGIAFKNSPPSVTFIYEATGRTSCEFPPGKVGDQVFKFNIASQR